ncbi:hypothetical protein FBU31_001433 [Coemansia sp. 'formosensis']|nr:hypothetical protein FBU31_001433 [Coemansia sp. 'formosensis']
MFPLHIAESIVDCIVGVSSPLLVDVKYDDYDECLLLLMPLLGVCRMFRSIVYSRYCLSYKIQLDYAEDTAIHYFSSWPSYLKQPNHPMHHLAKGIIVELDLWEVLDGKALKMFSGALDADSVFPLARKLTLQLTSFTPDYFLQELFDEHNPLAALANIGEFVQQLRWMAPRLGKIGVEVGTELHDWPRSVRPYFGSLVAQLFQLVTCVEFDSYDWLVLTATHVNAIRNLVRIKYHVGGTTNLLLLRANAATLQHIDIALINGGYVTGLVRDDVSEYI